jgi:hypothetical protein
MTIEPYTTAIVLTILFLAVLARSTFGFGDALIAMPLLSLIGGIDTVHFAKPLVAMISAVTAASIIARDWKSIEWKSAAWLILAAAAGIPFGLLFLTEADERVVKTLLAVLVISFSLFALVQPRLPLLKTDRTALLFGFLAGVLGGAYNAHGPPLVIYGALRRWPADRFRATLQAYFLPTSLLIVCGDGARGLWTADMFRHFLYSLPLIVPAVLLGRRLNARFSVERFTKVLFVMLLAIGALLLASAVQD